MQRLEGALAGWPGEYDAVMAWYEPLLEATYEDPRPRKADLEQLGQIAATSPSREQFLTDLTLDPPQAGSDEPGAPLLDEDYLILSSIHSAKGLEWTSVFILNTVDGCIPIDLGVGSAEEIEEERRLLYVAMTRARDELHLIQPSRFFVHGQPAQGNVHVTASRTRFIPSCILGHFERQVWPLAEPIQDARVSRSTVDIKSGLRSMWR
jgi:DNA helicase-2/ATP-dependent DNA helicase PcrA